MRDAARQCAHCFHTTGPVQLPLEPPAFALEPFAIDGIGHGIRRDTQQAEIVGSHGQG
jgi:hypothetical protein